MKTGKGVMSGGHNSNLRCIAYSATGKSISSSNNQLLLGTPGLSQRLQLLATRFESHSPEGHYGSA